MSRSDTWQHEQFGNIAQIANGQVSPLDEPYIDYVHVGPENIDSGTGSISGAKTARELGLISGKYLFDEQAILYSKIRPNLNKVCLPDFIGICSADIYPVWVLDGISREYLYQYLRSDIFVQEAVSHSGRTGLPKINRDALNRIVIPLPPLAEQRKIAAILSTWDEATTLTRQLIAALQRRKQALMQLLLTGAVRFPGFEDSEWKTIKLGEIATVRRGASPRPINDPKWFSDSGRAWIRIADVTASPTRFLNAASQYLSPLGEEKSVKVDVGDLIMSIAATIGVPKIVNVPACVHDGFVTFSNYETLFDKEFLYHYLTLGTSELANSGQPGTQKNINTSIVRNIDIPNLSKLEQEKIAELLNDSEEMIYLYRIVSQQLQTQKRGLMQQLLTGALRVQRGE